MPAVQQRGSCQGGNPGGQSAGSQRCDAVLKGDFTGGGRPQRPGHRCSEGDRLAVNGWIQGRRDRRGGGRNDREGKSMCALRIAGPIRTVVFQRVNAGGRNRKWPAVGGPCAAVHEIADHINAAQIVGCLKRDSQRADISATVEYAGYRRRGYRGSIVEVDLDRVDRTEISSLVFREVAEEAFTLLADGKRPRISQAQADQTGVAGAAQCVVSGLNARGVTAPGIVRMERDRYGLVIPAIAVRRPRQSS